MTDKFITDQFLLKDSSAGVLLEVKNGVIKLTCEGHTYFLSETWRVVFDNSKSATETEENSK